MDKNWNKARLDELAADFGSAASRRKLVHPQRRKRYD